MLKAELLAAERGEKICFENISFELKPHQTLIVTGANGVGKSTFLRVLAGLMNPLAGTVTWHNKPIEKQTVFLQAMTFIGHLYGLHPWAQVGEELAFIYTLHGVPFTAQDIQQDLEAWGLWGLRHHFVHTLSQGQKRKLALTRLFRTPTPLWILDEPFSSLDELSRLRLKKQLQKHTDQGGLLVISTHQPEEIGDHAQAQTISLSAFSPKPALSHSNWHPMALPT